MTNRKPASASPRAAAQPMRGEQPPGRRSAGVVAPQLAIHQPPAHRRHLGAQRWRRWRGPTAAGGRKAAGNPTRTRCPCGC
ncbi:hypothetical protein M8494_05360 [Serratia ureilytica]